MTPQIKGNGEENIKMHIFIDKDALCLHNLLKPTYQTDKSELKNGIKIIILLLKNNYLFASKFKKLCN